MEETHALLDVSYHGCLASEEDLMARDMDVIERVRTALLQEATQAYEDACIRGLCSEGAWEVAISAMRRLDLAPLMCADQVDAGR